MFNSLFGQKNTPILSYEDFWNWFQKNEKSFFNVVKNDGNLEEEFFNKIAIKLDELKDGFWYLTGMPDDNTVELIITVDGYAKNIVFAEELIKEAPQIKGWKFTALKPPIDIEKFGIQMEDFKFNGSNIFFYPNVDSNYPDEINLAFVHTDLTNENRSEISNGIYIFLDNYLGELDFTESIDVLDFVRKEDATQELIPISKLKEYIIWRKKEFIEKYNSIRHKTEDDSYLMLEATLKSGNKLVALVNSELMSWNDKPSHPWISVVTIHYDGTQTNGFPNKEDQELLNQIEDEIMEELKDIDGYLNVGRQTVEGEREIYFACKEFRKPSKILYNIQKKYSDKFQIDYDIYKDKYWKSLNHINPNNK